MKRIVFLTVAMLTATIVSVAQRYDYDDIYFNPKVDLPKKTVVIQSQNAAVTEAQATANTEPVALETSSMSYTDRINAFHRTSQEDNTTSALERRISDPNYTTNVFVLSDGQYLVDVDGSNITINENYNYPAVDWSGIYWNNPWYYGTSYYGWNWHYGWNFGWSWNWGWYNPYYGWGYNPWYYPHYGHHHCYHYWDCHHHHHNNYGHHHNSYDWNDRYVRRTSENDRRRVHAENYRWAANSAAPSRNASNRNIQSVSGVGGNGSSNNNTVANPNVPRSSAVNRVSSTTGTVTSEQPRSTNRVSNQLPARPSTSVSNRRLQSVNKAELNQQQRVERTVTNGQNRTLTNRVNSSNGSVNRGGTQTNTQRRVSTLPARPTQRPAERMQSTETTNTRATTTTRSNTTRNTNSNVNRSSTSRSTTTYRGSSSSTSRSSGSFSGGSRSGGGGSSTPRRR